MPDSILSVVLFGFEPFHRLLVVCSGF